ncbi:MAG: 50S ribosomal protein L19 [Candidatus Eiseniibacteriota bacterium]|jgi:large subunit ribosomal protein L19
MDPMQAVEAAHAASELPVFAIGDTVRVHYQVVEGNKKRTQVFEGTVIARHTRGIGSTFTVRKVTGNVGVERIFPLHSSNIARVEVTRRGRVRRAKLYYLRERRGKAARVQELSRR